jgi:hypothetical protein
MSAVTSDEESVFPALPDNLRPAEITGADMPALGIDPAKP